jgi:hypothetical protein
MAHKIWSFVKRVLVFVGFLVFLAGIAMMLLLEG